MIIFRQIFQLVILIYGDVKNEQNGMNVMSVNVLNETNVVNVKKNETLYVVILYEVTNVIIISPVIINNINFIIIIMNFMVIISKAIIENLIINIINIVAN